MQSVNIAFVVVVLINFWWALLKLISSPKMDISKPYEQLIYAYWQIFMLLSAIIQLYLLFMLFQS